MHHHTGCQSFDKLKNVTSVLLSGHTNHHQKSFATSESYMSNPANSYRSFMNDDMPFNHQTYEIGTSDLLLERTNQTRATGALQP